MARRDPGTLSRRHRVLWTEASFRIDLFGPTCVAMVALLQRRIHSHLDEGVETMCLSVRGRAGSMFLLFRILNSALCSATHPQDKTIFALNVLHNVQFARLSMSLT